MMRSATAFLPPSMITFMNLDSSTLPYFGSGRISRLGTSRRRGIFLNLFASVGAAFRLHRESHQDPHLLDPRHHGASGHYARTTRQAAEPRWKRKPVRPSWDAWRRTWNGPVCGP